MPLHMHMAPKFNPAEDLDDLTGKVVVITGATSGLGFPVAQELLRKGATVYLVARDESKAIGTIARLEAEGLGPGNGNPIFHKLILDNPKDAKKSAEEFLTRETRLDVLINNAAFHSKPYEMGPIGVQDIVTVNHLSPFVFTNTLLPLLEKTAQLPNADVRIVNVASGAHSFVSRVQFKSKADLNGPSMSNRYVAQVKRYAFTKLLNVLWTKELARRLASTTHSPGDGSANIVCLCLNPGAIATEGAYEGVAQFVWPISALLRLIIRTLFQTPADAASTVLIAAAGTKVRKDRELYKGAYLVPGGMIAEASQTASDEGLARELWALTEAIEEEGHPSESLKDAAR